ncbi:MAG: hypothetical protein ABR579_10255 [Actinomycetota bacterium]
MPPDNKLGRGLERVASDVGVDVQQSFVAVTRKAHRKQIARRTIFAAAAFVVIAGAAVGGAVGWEAIRVPKGAAPIAPAASSAPEPTGLGHEAYGQIAGSYTATIPKSGGVVSDYKLAGQWRMTFNRNGVVTFAAPFGYIQHYGPPELSTYSLAGTTLMTTALHHDSPECAAPGVYRWQVSGGTLTLTTLKDDCPYRPAVFASLPWKRQ